MMSEDKQRSDGQGHKMSWQERETALALQRLASARANLAGLEEQASPADPINAADPADCALADKLQRDIQSQRPKAAARFGAAAARAKIEECEFQQRLVLDRMGFVSYESYRAAADRPVRAVEVDATVLELARSEFRSAEESFLEIASMVIPPSDPVPPEEPEQEYDAEIITLQKPSAAS